MGGRGSVQLARVFGIRIGADYSWFLILFLAIFFAREQLAALTDASDTDRLHRRRRSRRSCSSARSSPTRSGHALAARREGIEVAGIDLFLFGGLMHMRSEPETPGAEFRVAAAGPAGDAAGDRRRDGGRHRARRHGRVRRRASRSTAPASSPLGHDDDLERRADQPARAGLQPDPRLSARRRAHRARGRLEGHGRPPPRHPRRRRRRPRLRDAARRRRRPAARSTATTFDGIYLAFLGWLLGSQARNVAVQSAFTERLEGVTVADLMDPEPGHDPGRHRGPARLRGLLPALRLRVVRRRRGRRHATSAAPTASRSARPPDGRPSARPRRSSSGRRTPVARRRRRSRTLLRSEPLRRLGALIAVDADGRLRGVVTAEQVARALRTGSSPTPLRRPRRGASRSALDQQAWAPRRGPAARRRVDDGGQERDSEVRRRQSSRELEPSVTGMRASTSATSAQRRPAPRALRRLVLVRPRSTSGSRCAASGRRASSRPRQLEAVDRGHARVEQRDVRARGVEQLRQRGVGALGLGDDLDVRRARRARGRSGTARRRRRRRP